MNFFKMILSLIAITMTAQVQADVEPLRVPAAFGKVYIPDGFDNNDKIEIVGEGIFPNNCYRYADSRVAVDHENKKITITTTAYKYNADFFLEMIMPFNHVLEVGLLKEGKYSVVREEDGKNLGAVGVRLSTHSEPDDFLYAPITQAFFQTKESVNKVYLTGEFPLSCMKMKEVKSHIQSDVLVILPIAEIDSNVPCKEGKFPFEAYAKVGQMKPGRYLLHVRTMNSKSVNSLVDVR